MFEPSPHPADPQKSGIFWILGLLLLFYFCFGLFWGREWFHGLPGPPGIDFATTDAQNSFLVSMSDHFSCCLTISWDKFRTNSRARILQGLRTGGHPDGNIFEKRHLFFQGPGFYKDCEQGVTLTEIFLKNDTFFPGALKNDTFERRFV